MIKETDKLEFVEQILAIVGFCPNGGRCHFLAAMQESNQRRWHRGGADREAYLNFLNEPNLLARLRAALPYVPLPALV